MIEQCSVWTEGSNKGDKVLHWHDLASCSPMGGGQRPAREGGRRKQNCTTDIASGSSATSLSTGPKLCE